jgi:hypothetical protein
MACNYIIRYINLEHRKDKNEGLIQNLLSNGFPTDNFTRFKAIFDKEFPQLGCALSHFECLKNLAISRKEAEFIVILEDDFRFSIDEALFSLLLEKVNSARTPWAIWQLFVHKEVVARTELLPPPFNQLHVHRILKGCGTVGYVVKREFTDLLLSNFLDSISRLSKNRPYITQLRRIAEQERSREALIKWHRLIDICALDNVWGALQINHQSIVIDAEIGRCAASFSDVLGRDRDADQRGFAEGKRLVVT